MYTVSRAPFNPVTKLYELSEHFVSEGELKGRLKKLKKKSEAVETTIGVSSGICGSSHASDSSYIEILVILFLKFVFLNFNIFTKSYCLQSIKKCELLDPYDQGNPTVIGMGRVHPSPKRIIHNGPMIDGFVKVQIDRVVEGCEGIRLLPQSFIPGAVEFLEDAKGSFNQWPAKSIKIYIIIYI
ncbi:hypothetical protein Hanom_Chr13g01229821 [Helianthus anomalus]